MDDAKHTPGPWTMFETSWSNIGIYAGDTEIAGLDIYDEATEETQDALEKQMGANARLIAAAPELLAALIDERRIRMLGQEPSVHWESLRDARRQSSEATEYAIAKATGADHG